jgi:hypothetical protein
MSFPFIWRVSRKLQEKYLIKLRTSASRVKN